MNITEKTAIDAVEQMKNDEKTQAYEAQDKSINKFTDSKSYQKKGCPRAAFIGLCEEGYVKGIKESQTKKYKSCKNKRYATEAANFLLLEKPQNISKAHLWMQVKEPKPKNDNGQMDVVLALWKKGYLCKLN